MNLGLSLSSKLSFNVVWLKNLLASTVRAQVTCGANVWPIDASMHSMCWFDLSLLSMLLMSWAQLLCLDQISLQNTAYHRSMLRSSSNVVRGHNTFDACFLQLSLGVSVLASSYTLASSSAAWISSWMLMGVKASMPTPPAAVAVKPGTKLNTPISSNSHVFANPTKDDSFFARPLKRVLRKAFHSLQFLAVCNSAKIGCNSPFHPMLVLKTPARVLGDYQ